MKSLLLTAAMFTYLVAAQAQDLNPSSVPSVVRNAFEQKYPKASDVEWEMQGNLYNVDFEIMFTDYEAWIDNSGKFVKVIKDIAVGDLPDAVKLALKTNFAGYRIDDAERIDANGTFTYKIDLEQGHEDRVVIMDEAGTVLENYLEP